MVKTHPSLNVKVSIDVPVERLGDLLCSALEGGSNYWYGILAYEQPRGTPEQWAYRSSDKQVFRYLDYPLNEGGALVFQAFCDSDEPEEVNGKTKFRFDLESARRGLQLMAVMYPHHYADFVNENDDATTGDVFLQLALFGEVIYG